MTKMLIYIVMSGKMGVSTRARYALRMMVRLARQSGASATVPYLSRAEDISQPYAAQLMMAMRRAGLVTSRRGGGGGVILARPPAEVSVADVIEAADGPIHVVECDVDGVACRRQSRCVTRAVWEEAGTRLKAYFGSVTLAALVARAEALDGKSGVPPDSLKADIR